MSSHRIAVVLLAAAACGPTQDLPVEGTKQQAIEFCGSTRVELTTNPPARFLSTGLISNGCTGVLLDAEHVLAAAHCFNDIGGTGNWQLVAPWHPANPITQKFYPNFHPDRVLASPGKVPRGDIDRAVVGSRTHPYPAADWGIGHIARWHDVNPADLTFTPLDGTLQNAIVQDWTDPDSDKSVERGPIENPAYVRGAFGGHPDLHWDNVTCDTDFDGNGTKGIWALDRKPAPTGEMTGCNQRWMAGSIISNCGIVTVRDDVVLHDCETWGGASGSPFLREKNGIVSVVGVGHGYASPEVAVPMPGICTKDEDCGPVALKFFCDHGLCAQKSANDQTPTAPVCLANDHKSLNVGASASRFLHAPRFASNVAVARRPDGDDATAVFAVDSDLNKVVFRERAGDLHSSPFTFWKPTPTVGGNEATLTRIAACSDLAGHPMVFVVGKQKGNNASRLFRTRFDPTLGDFLGWVPVALQNLDSSIDEDLVDVDAAYDDKGNCLLFALDRGEKTIAFTDMTSTSWAQQPAWQTINATSAPATGTSLTALRNHDGYLWVTTIDAGGKLWALAQQCAGSPNFWFTYPNIPDRQNVSKWRDVDAFWSNKGEGKLIALPESLDYKILVQFDLPSRTCNKWDVNGVPTQPFNDVPIQTTLWTPTVTTTTLRPTLTTLTAGRWLEDKPGDVSPVIFGTDDFGNVYFIANTVGTGGWRLRWQSFNHEWLFYP